MKVEALTQVNREQARELWKRYQTHRAYQTPADAEIAAVYKRIAQGKTVIRALDSIVAAGLNEQGLPRLALARADERQIDCCVIADGVVRFEPRGISRSRNRNFRVTFPLTDGRALRWQRAQAVLPLIPVHLRPKRGLQNYHILWEADWKAYPSDPYLLRRFGADAWLVLAAWELTDVERAVMAHRLHS